MASNGEGTFSLSRAGKFANNAVIKLCFSGKYTEKTLKDEFANHCGFVAHLNTNDCRAVEAVIAAGDEKAAPVMVRPGAIEMEALTAACCVLCVAKKTHIILLKSTEQNGKRTRREKSMPCPFCLNDLIFRRKSARRCGS